MRSPSICPNQPCLNRKKDPYDKTNCLKTCLRTFSLTRSKCPVSCVSTITVLRSAQFLPVRSHFWWMGLLRERDIFWTANTALWVEHGWLDDSSHFGMYNSQRRMDSGNSMKTAVHMWHRANQQSSNCSQTRNQTWVLEFGSSACCSWGWVRLKAIIFKFEYKLGILSLSLVGNSCP